MVGVQNADQAGSDPDIYRKLFCMVECTHRTVQTDNSAHFLHFLQTSFLFDAYTSGLSVGDLNWGGG